MASTYLTKAANNGANQRLFTFSAWVKATTSAFNGVVLAFRESSTRYCRIFFEGGKLCLKQAYDGSTEADTKTSALYRDASGWYHIVIAVDTAQATASNRIKMYVNGEQITSFSSSDHGAQNADLVTRTTCYIGQSGDGDNYFDGLMSHVHYIDGTAYAASTFGSTDSTTGEWKINTSPTLTMGTTGFTILKDGNTITDQSANSNNFTLGGGTLGNTEDCPSNVFCTLNSLGLAATNFTLIEGNLYSGGADNNWRSIFGTLGASSGKYYYEVKIISTANEHIGIASADQIGNCSSNTGKFTDSTYGTEGYAYTNGGQKSNNGTDTNWGNSYTTNDIIGVAFDLDNSKIYFSKNGTWQESGDPTSGSTGTGSAYTLVANKIYLPAMSSYGAASNMAFNFGNGYFRTTAISSEGSNASGIGKFEYNVPAGYTAVCTKGLNE